ncbi:putative GPI anchored protein [Xylogone sp. PMI_703]|nr:putative GPI anchored protein [Xylogone sp. PMI_703]
MRINGVTSLVLATAAVAIALPLQNSPSQNNPYCRFAREWSQKRVLADPDGFINNLLFWEGKFHQNNVSYNSGNGMSYDGTQLDWVTGQRTTKHPFSAASKEALQIMLYTHAIAGSSQAARFLTPQNPKAAPDLATSILELKLQTYLDFNNSYPGFGGFLPWFTSDTQEISPTWDWVNRVPGLDNGELLWAVYGCIQALEDTGKSKHLKLARDWQNWLDYAKSNVATIFYQGDGHVCAVTSIGNQTWSINDQRQTYSCEGTSYLNDPYEGELFTFFIQFFGGISDDDIEKIWKVKAPQLVKKEYHMGSVGPITVQEGYWFSSHETWKVMEMPYYDVDFIRRLYENAERVRTCNSVVTKIPGMFASVNNSTDPTTNEIISYISNAGIPSISNQTSQYLEVITPYSVFPAILFNRPVGLAWWRNMVLGKKMQNPYGSTESTRIDGTLVSALVTWDSKITTVNAILGGVTQWVRQKMKKDGIYDDFINYANRAYSSVFTELRGEHVSFCLPEERVPDAGLEDFTSCS